MLSFFLNLASRWVTLVAIEMESQVMEKNPLTWLCKSKTADRPAVLWLSTCALLLTSKISMERFCFFLFMPAVTFIFLFFITNLLLIQWKENSNNPRIPSSPHYCVCSVSINVFAPVHVVAYSTGKVALFPLNFNTSIGLGPYSWLPSQGRLFGHVFVLHPYHLYVPLY